MATLSDKGAEIVADMPVYAREDRFVQAIIDSAAREMQRIESYLNTIQNTLAPTNATDDLQLLSYWEAFLGLPIEPTGASESNRRTTILAAIRKRNAEAGTGWVSLIETVLDGATWVHKENTTTTGTYGNYRLLINSDLEPTDYRYGIFQQMVRDITPAHLQLAELAATGDETFRVGISEVGDQL